MTRAHIRTQSAVLALACLIACGCARAAPPDPAETDQRPLIETSHVIAPERIDDFVLDSTSYNDANKYAGAGFRYALTGHPETRIDIYVYPAGRMDEADALESGMSEFKAGLSQAEKDGYYRDMRVTAESEFPLHVSEATAHATDTNDGGHNSLDDEQAAIVRKLLEADRLAGRRLQLELVRLPQETPMLSAGYLFYKQLYFFKVRVSAAKHRIESTNFQALADRAARTLVPAIEVANIGGCANAVITIDTNAPPQTVAGTLMAQAAIRQADNCHEDETSIDLPGKSQGTRVIDIRFESSDWHAQ
jgi:hypothetical protein